MADLDTLARTIWGEARGEGMDGMAAVANVITNRVDIDLHDDRKPDWWGEGFREVCMKPWQFSCWNAGDPNRARLLAVTASDPQYADAMVLAAAAIGGKLRDRTNGATHYFAPKAMEQLGLKLPAWAQHQTPTAMIGDHVFYRSTV
jgi:spore germination cell wall hydrolase CwlJ-like protein